MSRFEHLFGLAGFLVTSLLLQGQIVINEVHYDPDVKVEHVEFIELHNAGSESVDLSGWTLSNAVDYEFPPGTQIPGGEYLVVAEDPNGLFNKFGATAIGPWLGRLANEGETITLRDVAGVTVDKVGYQLGFPWPTVGDPPGYSIELANPSFDNDLGGSWRVSVVGDPSTPGNEALVEEGSSWRYFKGLSEASNPATAWREKGYPDSAWNQGVTPIGYGESIVVTDLPDMRDGYTSVFFRKEFVVEDPQALGQLTLEVSFDDGVKAWINGVNVIDGGGNMSAGEAAFDSTASSALEDTSFRTYAVNFSPAALLAAGTNVLAIQAHNASIGGSSDFWMDARLLAALGGGATRGPTPGARNSIYTENLPPQIRQVKHTPKEPMNGEPVVISAKVTDPEGVAAVYLDYQIVRPGSYIALSDPEYETSWTRLLMNDQGSNGDKLADDQLYSVEIPGAIQVHRTLIRYRVTASDTAGEEVLVPYAEDPQPNFAYYVYDGVPGWRGAIRPGVEPEIDFAAEEMGRLPTYQLLSKKTDVEDCTWFSRYRGDQYLWHGTLVYDGEVYDHVTYRARGGVWRYAMCKNMWKFRFNRGHYLQARDNWGRKFNTKWSRLNLGASIQQGSFGHRGEQGMFESVGFRLFDLAGLESPNSTFCTLRIVDDSQEALGNDQFEGDFWGVYLVTEQVDGRFLDEHGLPDGNLYKMENGTGPSGANGELKNQGPYQVTDASDLVSFRSVAEGGAFQSDDWWRQNLDLDRYYRYQATLQAFHHYDVCCGKNYYYYNNPGTGRWIVLPWDLDLTWADNMYVGGVSGGTEPFRNRVLSDFSTSPSRPELSIQFKNQVRELRDLLWNSDQAFKLIDEYASLLQGANTGATILDADRAMWDYNPKMDSSTYSTNPSDKARTGRFYEAVSSRSFAGMVQKMKDYVTYRGSAANLSPAGGGLDGLASDSLIPTTPQVSYTGAAGYALNRLSFQCSAYSGSSGFAQRQWRIAEVMPSGAPLANPVEPNRYEMEAVWQSLPTTSIGERDITIPASVVRVGATYRVRSRVLDTSGRASHWSAPVQFVVGPLDGEAALVENLRLSEMMISPAESGEFEFLELHNRSDSLTLNLEGCKFTDGVDWAFTAAATIPPNGYLLLVKAEATNDFATFRSRYGLDHSVVIVGPYTGSLASGGEQVVLKAGRAGTEIVSFSYGNSRAWPLAAQGAGHSLVPLPRSLADQSSGSLDYPGNWRASTFIDGSPGAPDPSPPTSGLVLNEIAAHTDYFDAQRPEYDSNDWIELVNLGEEISLGQDWFLSDDPGDLSKWRIPAQTLGIGTHLSVDEVTGFHNPITSGFGLDKAGEQVLLSHLPLGGGGRVVDSVGFKGQQNDWSLGRFPNGTGDWQALSPRTRDVGNVLAPTPNLVLSEVMYHPVSIVSTNDNLLDEYVELYNPADVTVDLFNTNGSWRVDGGIGFEFPAQTTLAPGAVLLLVAFDPNDLNLLDSFKTHYDLQAGAPAILGPYSGKLSNRSDRIGLEELQYPDLPGDDYSWVIIDEVTYGNQDPWPTGPNGGGMVLERRTSTAVGNNPASWLGAEPSPGAGLVTPSGDQDNDGMPDAWEIQHNLDPQDPGDADDDSDQDTMTNLEEYQAGTDPWLGSDVLRLSVAPAGDEILLMFDRKENRSYSILYQDGLMVGPWLKLTDIPGGSPGGTQEVALARPEGSQAILFLLVTPAIP